MSWRPQKPFCILTATSHVSETYSLTGGPERLSNLPKIKGGSRGCLLLQHGGHPASSLRRVEAWASGEQEPGY
jgi:hypothetical protein